MKYIKLFEKFKSSKLSKIWKYYENDKGFADRFKVICNTEKIRLSELNDTNLEFYTTDEALEMLDKDANNINAYLFWFNDKEGYMMSCNGLLNAINIHKSSSRNEIKAFARYSQKTDSIRDCYDFCIVLYIDGNNSVIDNSMDLDYIKNKRRLIDKVILTDSDIRRINTEKYIKSLVNKVNIDPNDESLLSNFGYIVKKFFLYNKPFPYFHSPSSVSLSNIAVDYIELFKSDYKYMEDYIYNIKSSMERVYIHKDVDFISDEDLLKDCVLDLDEDAKNILVQLIEINQLLKRKLTNFKFNTVGDVYIFNQLLKTLSIGRSEDGIDYKLCRGNVEYLCDYLSRGNELYIKRQLRNLDIYKQLVEYTFKN